MTVVEDFAELFHGNTEAYGSEEGGCVRVGASPLMVPQAWAAIFDRHLDGTVPIGVYPMVPMDQLGIHHDHGTEWFVRWGAVDFDIASEHHKSFDYETENEAHVAACNLQLALKHLGVCGWIERTRSHGRHVWVFADSWVRASSMRRCLLVACGLAGVSDREVNPKSEQLDEGQLGNYVRLPYPGGIEGTLLDRCMIEGNAIGRPIQLDDFVTNAMLLRKPPSTFDEIARLYVPPVENKIGLRPRESQGIGASLEDRMSPYLLEVFSQEIPDDRSGQLQLLANLAARQTKNPFDPEEVYEILYDADERWGKFVGRSDRAQRLARTVEKAYR